MLSPSISFYIDIGISIVSSYFGAFVPAALVPSRMQIPWHQWIER